MSEMLDCVALEVNGQNVSLYDVLTPAKERGDLHFVQAAILTAIIRQEARRRGLEVSAEELQRAADDYRVARELFDAQTTEAWLAARRLSSADWESLIEADLLRRKLCEAVTRGKVEQHFAENKLAFDEAEISRLVVADEEVARELRLQITEECSDFHALARTYSIDRNSRPAGGYAGKFKRAELEAVVEAAVFGSLPGAVLGPFKLEDGWHLIKVEQVHRAELDDATRDKIESQLFDEWLEERLRKSEVKLPLLMKVEL
jgi:putative peptide maturation system protein